MQADTTPMETSVAVHTDALVYDPVYRGGLGEGDERGEGEDGQVLSVALMRERTVRRMTLTRHTLIDRG